MKKTSTIFLLFITSSLLFSPLQGLDYKVEIQGTTNKELISSLKDASQTLELKKKKPITTFQALRKRAEADVDKLNDVCHYYGYLSSEVHFTIKREVIPSVIFHIDLGPLYTIKSFTVLPLSFEGVYKDKMSLLRPTYPFDSITLKEIGIEIGQKASTQDILYAEDAALLALKKRGYAFAKVYKKEAIADVAEHTLSVTIFIDEGPSVVFGKTKITGNKKVDFSKIEKHILWKEGERFNPDTIEQTQIGLEKTHLFSSVIINEDVNRINEGKLPLDVIVEEGKHKSIAAGASYTTSKGPGVSFEWEDRNIRSQGEKLSFRADVWGKFQNANLAFRQPHYHRVDQDRIFALEFDRQDTLAYFSEAISLSSLIERRFSKKFDGLFGARLESLHSRTTEKKRTYYLVKTPFQIRWNNSKGMLDPISGQTLQLKLIPAYQFFKPYFGYLTHTTTGTVYHSFFDNSLTLASRVIFGNIFGASKHTIPTPDLFFSGTENTLRGYKYLTVSPLNKKHRPVGGRSILAGSFEARIRTESGIGWAFFYDLGHVYSTNFPVLNREILQSIGTGARYDTPLGPLRIDIAFPLNRRHKIDPPFQIYFSIGQSF
jgi:translocation and assembly module TamA